MQFISCLSFTAVHAYYAGFLMSLTAITLQGANEQPLLLWQYVSSHFRVPLLQQLVSLSHSIKLTKLFFANDIESLSGWNQWIATKTKEEEVIRVHSLKANTSGKRSYQAFYRPEVSQNWYPELMQEKLA